MNLHYAKLQVSLCSRMKYLRKALPKIANTYEAIVRFQILLALLECVATIIRYSNLFAIVDVPNRMYRHPITRRVPSSVTIRNAVVIYPADVPKYSIVWIY